MGGNCARITTIPNKISYCFPKFFPIITLKVGYRAFKIIKKVFFCMFLRLLTLFLSILYCSLRTLLPDFANLRFTLYRLEEKCLIS